ncbi:dipeptidase [Acetitomaculum ruminis DSM 5522]|uniref:Dipeptidase n=1 Tax=Acetitomaculum ruminis DSM 5522 TaxID=1120918 RepID=A0A1I0YP30_9FIRM|nr:C69 family dipeptidase [Acetitomaculum ruminis]SFB14220.1 dipeptidase [Acetitomaculum ruminis DSM 5522]
MPCTTVLVGKKASNDNTTMIARTDDGFFDVKKIVVIDPKKQPKKYKGVLTHVEVDLPDNPMRYTSCPSVDKKEGIWAATGINEANVGMTATETITSNPRVLAADPLVELQKPKKRGEKEILGGIGEEDFVVLVLPYIHTARQGVERLASLIEKYGTCESNGIAFNDENEVWWMETIGGHHYIARRVKDDEVVVNPNQFGMDYFDFEDAFGAQKENMCSADLKEFMEKNHLNLNKEGEPFNPRYAFGSHTDSDHVYNTPRAWFMGRYLTPFSHKWEGENAEFTPESDKIPWSFVPDKKVTVEDVKYMLSSYYQGTEFNPYLKEDTGKRGKYRSIGINRTGVTSICQIRSDVPDEIKGIEWICFASTAFNVALPLYTNTPKMPKYVSDVTLDTSTENLYWSGRLIEALADANYATAIAHIERYQRKVFTKGRQLILEYDKKMIESKDFSLTQKANEDICNMVKEASVDTLNKVLMNASQHMKNGYNRADN